MKKASRSLKPNFLFILFLLSIILVSCNSKEEGCLDIRASNFDFNADKPCEDCCTYPKLYFRMRHIWDDSTAFRQSQVYTRAGVDTFKLIDIDYAFSAFLISDIEGLPESVEETIEIWCNENGNIIEKEIVDDVIVINLTNLTYEIGTFRRDELFTTGEMTIGIPSSYDCAIADSLQSSAPLSAQSVIFHPDDMIRVFARVVLQKDTSRQVFDTLYIPNKEIQFNFDLNKDFKTGKPDTIYCTVSYQQWFREINISTDENDLIIQQMSSNMPSGIEIE